MAPRGGPAHRELPPPQEWILPSKGSHHIYHSAAQMLLLPFIHEIQVIVKLLLGPVRVPHTEFLPPLPVFRPFIQNSLPICHRERYYKSKFGATLQLLNININSPLTTVISEDCSPRLGNLFSLGLHYLARNLMRSMGGSHGESARC